MRPASDIVESSTNGLSGVKMPVQVTLREGVELAEDDLEDAVSFAPVDFDVTRLGMRMLRIIPRSPLKYDTRYKVTLDASKLTGGKAKGVAEFEFATPKLRFSYSDYWLQQSDDLKYYVLVGETVSSDYAESGYVEKNLKISGLKNPDVAWVHSANGTTHQIPGRKHPPGDEGLYADARFRPTAKRNRRPSKCPRRTNMWCWTTASRRNRSPVVVTFSEPLKQSQEPEGPDPLRPEIPHLGRQEPALHLPRNARHGKFRHRNKPERAQQERAAAQGELYVHGQPALAGAAIRFAGKGSVLPSSNRMSLLFESVNFARARVRVRKIFANNLLQFFQRNYYGGDYYSDMEYVSRIVRDTTIDLSSQGIDASSTAPTPTRSTSAA